jgi:PAS domain S-box-containing protein
LHGLGTLWGLRATGEEFPIEASISRVETGGKKFFIAVIRDITERHRAEEAVRESEQRFRLVADTAPVLMWMSDADKLCTYFNKPWLDFTGRSIEGELGNGWAEGVHQDDLERCLDTYKHSFDRREEFRMEYRLRRHDGEYRWIIDIGVPRFNKDHSFAGYIGSCIDVTERKRAEVALRKSEERMRLAQSAARIGTFEWNIRTGVNTWTPELEGMYGLPPGGFGGTQTAFENLVHPDDRERVIELDNWALKTGQPTEGEWRVVWPDGSVHWIVGRWQVYMNESGQPTRMVGVNIDITDRKLAEQELSKANERLRLALEAGSAGGWDYDLKTGKDVWFGTAHTQLGVTPDETLGSRKEFWDRIHEDDHKRVEYALRVAKEKRGEFAEDVRVVWRDGTTHWLRSRGRFQYGANGEAERSLGISLDITERKMAEDRLREYEKAVEGAEDMIGVVDREYRFLLANRQYLRMRELTREQVVGHFIADVLGKEVFETDIKPQLDECFRGHVVKYEMKFSYPAVGERDLLLSYFPIEADNGTIDRAACILHDITDRKRAEEVVSSMSRKLIEAQEQERARIGRELHDNINQRLAVLAVALDRLQGEPSDIQSRTRELQKDLAEISSDVQAMTHELHSSSLEYLGVCAGMKSWCKVFAERQRIEVDFRGDVASVLTKETGLTLFRVLQEALHNVIKHSGVKHGEVRLRENSGEIHLTVRDLGRGFEIDAATQSKGLGLTSMRERVRLVNGTITIDSKPMRGTTIHVCVPLPSERRAKGKAV